mmetsp:Transcript_21099/g.45773  ORF Transcript_21099/g.45773 Transcript_21099/m.45773 type:complete len:85 (+) Transcript_21099:1676-1930(+)
MSISSIFRKESQDPQRNIRNNELNVNLRERTVLEKRSIAKMNNDDKTLTSFSKGGCEDGEEVVTGDGVSKLPIKLKIGICFQSA